MLPRFRQQLGKYIKTKRLILLVRVYHKNNYKRVNRAPKPRSPRAPGVYNYRATPISVYENDCAVLDRRTKDHAPFVSPPLYLSPCSVLYVSVRVGRSNLSTDFKIECLGYSPLGGAPRTSCCALVCCSTRIHSHAYILLFPFSFRACERVRERANEYV